MANLDMLNNWQSREQQIANSNEAMDKRKKEAQNTWAQMLQMANATKPETMLGFQLGRLLSQWWLNNKEKRIANKEAQDQRGMRYYDPQSMPLLGGEMQGAAQVSASRSETNPEGQTTTTEVNGYAPFRSSDYPIADANQGGFWDMVGRNMTQDIPLDGGNYNMADLYQVPGMEDLIARMAGGR